MRFAGVRHTEIQRLAYPLLRRVSILDLTALTINVNEVYLFDVDQRIYDVQNSGGVREHPFGQV